MGDVPDENERRRLGLDAQITRRDFVNGALVGGGSALGLTVKLRSCPHSVAQMRGAHGRLSAWTPL
jgi:hypothetical protein